MIDSATPNRSDLLDGRRPHASIFLLGTVDFRRCLALQERLVYESCTQASGHIAILICEHPPIITIGRGGSREEIGLRQVQLAGRPVEMARVARGGGTMLHVPGQLAVYPIAPLDWLGWTVGQYLARLQAGMLAALKELSVDARLRPERHGVWGRSGQLVSMGVAVKDWTTLHGAQLNVLPPLHLSRYIETDSVQQTPAGSLYAELRRSVRMAWVRSRVARSVAEAFDCRQYHLYTSHPLLSLTSNHGLPHREAARAC